MQKTPSNNLQGLFKTYVAKSGDEEKFRKAHITTVVDNNDKNLGPKEDQFMATTKVYPRDASHHGYEVGGDEKVYSEDFDELDEGWGSEIIKGGAKLVNRVRSIMGRGTRAAPPGAPRLEAPGVAAARSPRVQPRTPGRDMVPISQRSDRSLTVRGSGLGRRAAMAAGTAATAVGTAAGVNYLMGDRAAPAAPSGPAVTAARSPSGPSAPAPAAPRASAPAPAAPRASAPAPAAPRAARSAAPTGPAAANRYSSYRVGGTDVTSDVQDIVRANPSITNPNAIRAGQNLRVGDSDYTVQRGDTLSGIAARRRASAPTPAPAPAPAPAAAPAAPEPTASAPSAPAASSTADTHTHSSTPGTRTPRQIRADARAEIRTGRVNARADRMRASGREAEANRWQQRKQADIAGDVERAYGHEDRASRHYGDRAEHGRELNRIRRGATASSMNEAMTSKDRYDHHHGHAKSLIKSISDHLESERKQAHGHVGFGGNKGPDWGHVGSMEHIAKQLSDIHDQLARSGEYSSASRIAEEQMSPEDHYKADLPQILKDIRGKRKGHSDLRREYGGSWKRLANSTAAEHGHDYNRSHLLSVGQKHLEDMAEAVDPETQKDWDKHAAKKFTDDEMPAKGAKMKYAKLPSKSKSAAKAKEDQLDEKTLTPAEIKKREEVAQAIERENPDMPMSKKMAIATAQAKKVAEEIELGESVMSDDAIDHLEKAGAEDAKTTTGGIHYKAGGKEYTLRHNMKRSGHRTVRTAELEKHIDRLKALKESAEQADTLCLKEGSFKSKMLDKGYNSLQSMIDEDSEVDE